MGYEITDKNGSKVYPCIKIEPVDTTAAGDTLCGGMAMGLAKGELLADAVRLGSTAASITCTKMGAQPSIPTKEEVENFCLR